MAEYINDPEKLKAAIELAKDYNPDMVLVTECCRCRGVCFNDYDLCIYECECHDEVTHAPTA